MTRCMRKEARAMLSWCLAQRGPFTRSQCADGMRRDVASVRDQLERFVSKGYLEQEIDYTNHYTYMVSDRAGALEAVQQQPKQAAWIEQQRRHRLKQQQRRVVNSVFSLGAM